MIKIVVISDNNKNIRKLTVSGHAGYAKKGEDIVCAGVSALTYTLLNAMEAIVGISSDCEVNEGYVSYTLPEGIDEEKFRDSQLLLKSIVLGYRNMYDSYKTYIEVFEEEV